MQRVDRQEVAAIFAGGAVGALARTALARTGAGAAPHFPWLTLAVNVLGAFLLGYLVAHLRERPSRSRYWRPLLGTGFCGAFTTFSTMQLELVRMVDVHRFALAGAYVAASLVGGLAAVRLATALVRPSGRVG